MKLKTNNTAKKPTNAKKNKSPKKQSKGVEIRKDKQRLVDMEILLKEAEKLKKETPLSPQKILQRELWEKAIENVSNMSNLSEEESNIVKLLSDFKKKSSIPQKSIKLKNFITKGFSKFKDTSDDVLDGIYNKLLSEFKAVGGVAETIEKKVSSKKTDKKPKSKTEDSDDEKIEEKMEDDDEEKMEDDDEEKMEDDDEENEDDVEDDDDELEGDLLGEDDDDDDEGDSEEEDKPIIKGNKANNKNGKGQPNKGKNGSKFKSGKVQKNKKFGKKK